MYTNRFLSLLVAITLLFPIVIKGVGLATASYNEANGTFTTTSTTIHSVTEDKFNETIDLSTAITYTGTLEGTSTLHGTLTIHRDGSANFQGEETFTGSVNGMPGTLTFEVVGSNNAYQMIQLTKSITSGSGELASLYGVLSMAGVVKDTYAGQINNQ